MTRRWLPAAAALVATTLSVAALAPAAPAPAPTPAASGVELPSPARLAAVRDYISKSWTTLRRSLRDLPAAARDPKLHLEAGKPWPVYIPARESQADIEADLKRQLSPADFATISVRPMPRFVTQIREHGLLYLPRPYVVPGGRFNEMYGWDSYFIQVGLLRDNELAAARDMALNFIYEIENYGTLLNANRTYYLTRSQPPFLTRMVLGVYEKERNRSWLRSALPAVEKYYEFWTTDPHLVEATGLSRYYDTGDGAAPEVQSDEKDAQGRTHYDRAREYYKTHEVTDYDVSRFYDAKADTLTPLFYKGDRSMRESGFDPSNRFGPFSVDIVHHVPVCLNSLLYQMEKDGAEIARAMGDPAVAITWEGRARDRQRRIDRYLWDERSGLYLDYNFETKKRRHYEFATTFYPLWAGAASKEQAARVVKNLPLFEAPGGILTSTQTTGNQWDAPFGWAPLQLIAVEGLRRYGYHAEADRISRKFIALVTKEFEEHGTIVEKYDVKRRESDVAADIKFGYSANQVGFGWTNGVFVELLEGLDQKAKAAERPAAPSGARVSGRRASTTAAAPPPAREDGPRPSP
jgi:alpha,alpha-trehalase